jgi:hypothetical protein
MPKTSLGRSRLLKPNVGLGGILAQSDTVVRAFGRDRGFLLMLIALVMGAGVPIATAVLLMCGIGRVFG